MPTRLVLMACPPFKGTAVRYTLPPGPAGAKADSSTVDANDVLEAILRAKLVRFEAGETVEYWPALTEDTEAEAEPTRARLETALGCTVALNALPIVDGADSGAVDKLVNEVLDRVQPGDRLLVEFTNGKRALTLGLLAAALYTRALKPGVKLLPTFYGDITTPVKTPPSADRTPSQRTGSLHHAPQLLDLIDWARAAQGAGDALVLAGLLERLHERPDAWAPGSPPSLTGNKHRDALNDGIALGLTPLVIKALRNQALPDEAAMNKAALAPVRRAALSLVRDRLGLVEQPALCTRVNRLDLRWLDAELALVAALHLAGRKGEAARVLREWCVNVVIYAQQGPCGPEARWYQPKNRRRAEGWLGARAALRREGRGPTEAPVEEGDAARAPRPEAFDGLVAVAAEAMKARNALSHAGYDNQGENEGPKQLKLDNALGWWSKARAWLGDGGQLGAERTVFLNLSNHPSDKWSPEQHSAALHLAPKIHRLVDVPFGEVPPEHSDIKAVVQGALGRVNAAAPTDIIAAAMVAGEPVAVSQLVHLLEAVGVRCYAATIRREVMELDNGVKQSRFTFVQFRPFRSD